MSLFIPVRRIERVRHELRPREVEVVRVEPVGPHFASITFFGESLADFASDGFDDHVKFIFDNEAGEPVKRDYTPRRFDRERRELTIEFVLHGKGPACEWARTAKPGASAIIGGPKGSMIIPLDYDWHLLAGDPSALPAIHRRLGELPADTRAIVRIQAVASDRRGLAAAAALDLQWLAPEEDLADHVRRLTLPTTEGFAWAAGEAGAMTRLRDVILVEKRHPREAMRVAAYWKPNEGSFHENL